MGLGHFLQPESIFAPLPLHITTVGRFTAVRPMLNFGLTPQFANGGWTANNRAIYMPVTIPQRFTVARFCSPNGNPAGNSDMGLYDWMGTRLLSTGTVARAGTNVVQYFGVTDQSFSAGRYYIALVLSTTSGSIYAAVADQQSYMQIAGVLQEDLGSTVLPVTMTPAIYASTVAWCFGFTQSDSF